jgi:hypothetical protein
VWFRCLTNSVDLGSQYLLRALLASQCDASLGTSNRMDSEPCIPPCDLKLLASVSGRRALSRAWRRKQKNWMNTHAPAKSSDYPSPREPVNRNLKLVLKMKQGGASYPGTFRDSKVFNFAEATGRDTTAGSHLKSSVHTAQVVPDSNVVQPVAFAVADYR